MALNCNQWTIKVYLISSNKADWDCIFGIVSALPCYGMAPTWTKLCLCLYICTLLMQGQWKKGRDCHIMMHMHKRWIKHDALTNLCNSNIMCHKISEMKYLSKHMHENDMWFSYQSHSRITIFLWFRFQLDSTRTDSNSDSDSESDSRVYQNSWFRFQFWLH